MLKILRRIIAEYLKWYDDWDDLCHRCGQCCYTRSLSGTGEVIVEYSRPCEFLDEDTHLCSVFKKRFRECAYCKKVNLYNALFNPLLPSKCAYVETFRLWPRKGN